MLFQTLDKLKRQSILATILMMAFGVFILICSESYVRFGRPPKEVPPFFAEVVNAWESGEITLTEALERCNMGSSTFYRRLYEFRMKNPADH